MCLLYLQPFLQCKGSKSVDDIAIPAVSKDSEKILPLSTDGGLLRFDELFKKAWEQSSESEESDDAEDGDLISKEASIVFSDGFEHGQTPAAQDMALEEALGDLKAAVLSATEDLRKQAKHQEVWAVMEGVEGIASNFLNLVPDMALTFPFELDTFQKEVGLLFKK
jgi:antiviral helicase SKI2